MPGFAISRKVIPGSCTNSDSKALVAWEDITPIGRNEMSERRGQKDGEFSMSLPFLDCLRQDGVSFRRPLPDFLGGGSHNPRFLRRTW
jgi:hypothetical protein